MDTLEEYMEFTTVNHLWPEEMDLPYTALGLVGEAGEYAEKVKKLIRDNTWDPMQSALELGDVLWYLTNAARSCGYSLEEVMLMNMAKLRSRADREALRGSGDNR